MIIMDKMYKMDSVKLVMDAAANITIDTLLNNNPNVNSGCTNIYPGEVSLLSRHTNLGGELTVFLGPMHLFAAFQLYVLIAEDFYVNLQHF